VDEAPKPTIKRKVSRRGRLGEGRPSKCTPETTRAICRAYAKGLSLEDAARVAGVARDAAFEWSKDAQFSEALKKARAQRQLFLLEQLEASGQAWTRFAWLLERLDPATYHLQSAQLSQTVNASPEFRISVERAEDLTRRSAALEAEAEALLNARQPSPVDGAARNRLQGLL
jgi:hypothetical protein